MDRLLREHDVNNAPVRVATIAETLRADVQYEPAEDDLSGFLYRDRRNKRTVIGVNAAHHPNRQAFTIAHELGHLLLHDFEDVHVDRKFKVWLRSETSSQGSDLEEKEANLFAAELLMPARFIKRDVSRIVALDISDDKVIQELAEQYGVSTQAMTFRLTYLGYVEQ